MTTTNHYPTPQAGHAQPQYYPPAPRRVELLHLLVWPALALSLTAMLVALTGPSIEFPITFAAAGLAIAASLPGVVVGLERQNPLATVAFGALLLGLLALVFGFVAYGQYQDAMEQFRDALSTFGGLGY